MKKRYRLIKDNNFYGKEGTIIGQIVYNNLPTKHQKLFEEIAENELKVDKLDFIDSINKIRAVLNEYVPDPFEELEDDDDDYDDDEEDDDELEDQGW